MILWLVRHIDDLCTVEGLCWQSTRASRGQAVEDYDIVSRESSRGVKYCSDGFIARTRIDRYLHANVGHRVFVSNFRTQTKFSAINHYCIDLATSCPIYRMLCAEEPV